MFAHLRTHSSLGRLQEMMIYRLIRWFTKGSMTKRMFSRSFNVLQDESFMNKYYDNTNVPKESELDPDELRTRLESWFVVV